MKRILICVLCCAGTIFPQAPTPADLLKESFNLESKIQDIPAQVYQLTELAYLSAKLAPEQTHVYCVALQKAANMMPYVWNRVASQKNALVPCSDLSDDDAKWAFESLRTVDPMPKMLDHYGMAEDPRTDAANRFILPRYFKHFPTLKSLRQISIMADFLAAESQYPWEGVGDVLKQAASLPNLPIRKETIRLLFLRAYRNYKKPNRIVLGNDGHTFYMFLKYTQGLVGRQLYRSAVQSLVDIQSKNTVWSKDKWYGELVDASGKVIYSFHDWHTIEFYRELDVLRSNPLTLKALMKQNPVYGMDGEVKNTLIITDQTSQEESDQRKAMWDQRQLAAQMKTLSVPQKGEEILGKLTDPTARVSGLCYFPRILAKSDPNKNDQLIWHRIEAAQADCLSEYEKLADGTPQNRADKLNASAIILETSFYTHPDGFANRYADTFNLAVTKYEEQVLEEVGWRPNRYSTYDVVARLAAFAVEQNQAPLALTQINGLRHDTFLRSRLLLEVARKLGEMQPATPRRVAPQ